MSHDGREFLSVFQKAPEWENAVREPYPVVVIKEKNAKASQAGYRDEVLWAVGPIAEGGPKIDETGNLEVSFRLSGRRRTGKDKKKRAGDKQDDD